MLYNKLILVLTEVYCYILLKIIKFLKNMCKVFGIITVLLYSYVYYKW
jgi:hypothetical protein